MDAGLIERVETGAERGASALFAGAVGYAAYGFLTIAGIEPLFALGAAAAGLLAYLPCNRLLHTGQRGVHLFLPDFEPRSFEFVDAPEELLLTEQVTPTELLLTEQVTPDELVLTDADRVDGQAPLVLDDILSELAPDSRVVRLFDRKAMPTPGQLQSRIADHLGDGAPPFASTMTPTPSAHSDAAQALSAALAELRRSLR